MKDTAWAATKEDKRDGQAIFSAVGTACNACYVAGTQMQGFASWEKYCEGIESGVVPLRRMEQIAANVASPCSDVAFPPVAVHTILGSTISVEKTFRAKNLASIKTMLNQARVSQKALVATPKISMPIEGHLDQREDLWLFTNDDSPLVGTDKIVTVKTFMQIQAASSHLADAQNTWSGHGEVVLQSRMRSHFEGPALTALTTTKSLQSYCQEFGESARRDKRPPVFSPADKGLGIRGAGAQEFACSELADASDKDFEVDPHETYTHT
jgi:hypothetical protein